MKSKYIVLILSMSALTACGGGGGGTTEPTSPQPTTPNVQEQTHNSVKTKTAKADMVLLAVTNFDDPVDGNSGRFQVEAGKMASVHIHSVTVAILILKLVLIANPPMRMIRVAF